MQRFKPNGSRVKLLDDPPTPPPALKESTSSSAVDGKTVHTGSQVSASRLPPQALSLQPSRICLKLSLESDCCASPPAIISVPAIVTSGGTQQYHAVSWLWLPYRAVTESDQECPATLWPVTSSTRLSRAMIFYGLPFISVSPNTNSPSALPRDIGICPAFEVILFPVLYPRLLNHLPALSSVFSSTQRCRHMYTKSLLGYLGLYQHRETRGSATVFSAFLPRAHKIVFAILPALSHKSVKDWKMTMLEFQKLGHHE